MHTCLKKLLCENNIDKIHSYYKNANEGTMNFDISAGDFFDIYNEKEIKNFNEKDMEQAEKIELKIEELRVEIKKLKKKNKKEHDKDEKIKEMRTVRRHLEEQLKEYKCENDNYIITYKKCVYAKDFDSIIKEVPFFKHVKFPYYKSIPYFTNNLDAIKRIIDSGEKIAVTGGPCLFGVNEVEINVYLKNGQCYKFDYSTGKRFGRNIEINIREFLSENEIEDIDFTNNKEKLTTQEFDSILYLFELADKINAPITIPLPDLSYVKYLSALLQKVDEEKKKNILNRFRKIAYKITDMYLEVVEILKKQYPKIKIVVLHERNKEACEKYYSKRKKYIEVHNVLRKITKIPEKLESIKDYISMPALPYYLFDIPNIIMVNSIDESDSYRKCRIAHKNVINMVPILYPERVSDDGINTIFETDCRYKEYITVEDYYHRMNDK